MTKKELREKIKELERQLSVVVHSPYSRESLVIGTDVLNKEKFLNTLLESNDYSDFIKKYPQLNWTYDAWFLPRLKWVSFADYYQNKAQFPPIGTKMRSKTGAESVIEKNDLNTFTFIETGFGLINYARSIGLEILA